MSVLQYNAGIKNAPLVLLCSCIILENRLLLGARGL